MLQIGDIVRYKYNPKDMIGVVARIDDCTPMIYVKWINKSDTDVIIPYPPNLLIKQN